MPRHLLPLAVLLLPLLAGCGSPQKGMRYSGTIEFPDVEVGSLVGGRVLKVLADEGATVSAQDVLVELDPSEWQSNLDEARAQAEATQRELELLQAGARAEDIAQARAVAKRLELLWQVAKQGSRPEEVQAAREEVTGAAARVAEAERDVDRLVGLVRTHTEPSAKLDEARTALSEAQARQAVAEQRMKLLQHGLRPEEIEAARQAWVAQSERVKSLEAGTRPEEIAAHKATLEAAQARIRLAETKLRELRITAPADAVVQTLDLRPGDLIRAGQPVAVLLLSEEPWTMVYVPERDLARVHVGQRAHVHPDGHAPLEGRVTWISRRAEYTPRNVQTREERVTQVFPVKVVISGNTDQLKDGMWADVTLE
jgi:multidrug resistance efflux pump